MVRERAVQLRVELLERERQPVEDLRNDKATHAVARVADDLQRPQGTRIDERADVGGVLVEEILRREGAALLPRREISLGHRALDLLQARLLTDGAGPAEAQLDSPVLRGIVRRSEHGARRVELPGSEVDE